MGEPCPPPPADDGVFDPVASAKRLFANSRPIAGTLAEAYLRARGVAHLVGCTALRFHPRCVYRPERDEPSVKREAWPALIARITDIDGAFSGVHRTWLDPSTSGKAPVASPRRAMGRLRGHGVRFAGSAEVMAAGEGLETLLSVREVLPDLTIVAALSASHLGALRLPQTLRRLYIARDNDAAGRRAAERLSETAGQAGVETIVLAPTLGDFNDDLRQAGRTAMAAAIRVQLAPEDVERFLRPDAGSRCGAGA